MYGNSKDDGAVIGLVQGDSVVAGGDQLAQDSTRAEEALLGEVLLDEESGRVCKVCWQARLSPESGDLQWIMTKDCAEDDDADGNCKEGIIEQIHNRTLAMSLMTSMLRDDKRNSVYAAAIRKLVHNFIDKAGAAPMVLDVGSGTSLLSLLVASTNESTTVIGCEMFDAMAAVGQAVVACNGFDNRISIVPCKSTELDQLFNLERKPDLLVSVLLDSALLGESCIFSHAYAIANTLNHGHGDSEPGRIAFDNSILPVSDRVIPHNAHIKVALIESELVGNMISVNDSQMGLGGCTVFRDDVFAPQCKATRPVIPLHWEILHNRGGRVVSNCVDILNVDFYKGLNSNVPSGIEPNDVDGDTDAAAIQVELADEGGGDDYEYVSQTDSSTIHITVTSTAGTQPNGMVTVHGVLLWWDLFLLSPVLDPERAYHYSTVPRSHTLRTNDSSNHHDEVSENQNSWQDHWVQCVYPLPRPIECHIGDTLRVTLSRDFINIAMQVVKDATHSKTSDIKNGTEEVAAKRSKLEEEPVGDEEDNGEDDDDAGHDGGTCSCGWHMLCGAERLAMLNDKQRNQIYNAALKALSEQLIARQRAVNKKAESSMIAESSDGIKTGIVLDVGDGSLLSLGVGKHVAADEGLSNLKILSVEQKDYSRLLHSQLVDSNNLGVVMEVWDGDNIDEMCDYISAGADDDDEEEEDGEDGEDEDIPKGNAEIVALISECFHYQLSSLPTWEALSFWYKRSSAAVCARLAVDAVMFPRRAKVYAAAVSLPELCLNHGPVGRFVAGWTRLVIFLLVDMVV
jgi:hypothetical protein